MIKATMLFYGKEQTHGRLIDYHTTSAHYYVHSETKSVLSRWFGHPTLFEKQKKQNALLHRVTVKLPINDPSNSPLQTHMKKYNPLLQ